MKINTLTFDEDRSYLAKMNNRYQNSLFVDHLILDLGLIGGIVRISDVMVSDRWIPYDGTPANAHNGPGCACIIVDDQHNALVTFNDGEKFNQKNTKWIFVVKHLLWPDEDDEDDA